MNAVTYVSQLPPQARELIRREIDDHLRINVGLAPYQAEYHELMDHALNSRLCDLAEVIDITDYLTHSI